MAHLGQLVLFFFFFGLHFKSIYLLINATTCSEEKKSSEIKYTRDLQHKKCLEAGSVVQRAYRSSDCLACKRK
jgi:hypothetical protein